MHPQIVKQVITVPCAAAAYSAGDGVGAASYSDVHEIPACGIYIRNAVWVGADRLTPDLRMHCFSDSFAGVSDNAAFSIPDADAVNYLGYIDVAAANWTNTTTAKEYSFRAQVLMCQLAGKRLYWQFQLLTAGETFVTASGYQVGITYQKLFPIA